MGFSFLSKLQATSYRQATVYKMQANSNVLGIPHNMFVCICCIRSVGFLLKSGCYSLNLEWHILIKEISERKSEMPKISNSVQSAAKCEIITENMWPAGTRSAKSYKMSGGSSPAKKRSAKSLIVAGSIDFLL